MLKTITVTLCASLAVAYPQSLQEKATKSNNLRLNALQKSTFLQSGTYRDSNFGGAVMTSGSFTMMGSTGMIETKVAIKKAEAPVVDAVAPVVDAVEPATFLQVDPTKLKSFGFGGMMTSGSTMAMSGGFKETGVAIKKADKDEAPVVDKNEAPVVDPEASVVDAEAPVKKP